VYLPAAEGPVVARDPKGAPWEILDVADYLIGRFKRIYIVDLDGIEHNRPQLDYLQEIARDTETWVDAGIRTADQAIDILITGARRAVISSARMQSMKEVRRTWKLSQDLAFEIETRDLIVQTRNPEWATAALPEIVRAVREIGLSDIVLSPRGDEVDWSIVRELAPGGPLWVDGTFEASAISELKASGAAGGIFHIEHELAAWTPKEDEKGEDQESSEIKDPRAAG
jgi:Histidine biosynthesis protein